MSGVAIAIGGAAVIGAGAGIGGSMIAGEAARRATGGALSQLDIATWNAQNNLNTILSLYQPFISAGTNALNVLQSRIMSGSERAASTARERLTLQSKIDQLSKPTDWNSFPILTGEKASERRLTLFTQAEFDRKQKLAQAQSELDLFNKEQGELAGLYEKQDQENQARMTRIQNSLDQVAKLSNIPTSLADIRGELEDDPVYQFRRAEGERSINRAAAARGTFFSGRAIEELSDFSLALTGEETDKYINRKLQALSGAVTGLNAELGEQGQSVSQALSLTQLGLGGAQGAGTAISGESQTQAQLAGGAAQTTAAGEMAKGTALQGGLNSISSTAGSLAALTFLSKGKTDTTNPAASASDKPSIYGTF